ncbi:cysteine desulfurase family protein [Streptococcus dysgalactiae]|uniref:cysteine desulfurase n=1 Tax=Streptococcus dysgalactiae subsp. equisimilis TaxID=119602 RepID=A0A9X8SZ12_STREQ|nr:cysteine desulfurase family protein [Streptococcus dysgalactiae]SQF66869.1 cysteine desulfhydrase [Streptococcus dysgalactiae subsp. equisimilis]VEF07655.1 cysteine desulfhydrase [Streptococcus dysgalactiae subsp. equisimilis]
MIYFDNAATTPLSPSVITVMTETMTDVFGNPSSIHSYGRQASKTLRESRQTIANLLDVNARHIIFTSGGTESNNTAIKGYALANQNKGKHLVTTAIEHHSVLHTMAYLEDRFGFEVTYLPCQNGTIDLADVKKALRDDTILVSMMYANNETGDVLPIQEIGNLLRDHQAVFHVDAVQAIGKFDIFPEQLGIDFLSASAHKFHGPKGIGFLYSRGMIMDSLLHGGEQEHKRRASTENLPGIVGMAQALKDALTNCLSATNHITSLRDHLLEQLEGLSYYLNQGSSSLPQVINIGFPGYQNGVLLTQLDLAGFAVSTGSACTAGTVEPSHVLAAYYGKESHRLTESIRISLSDQNTFEEVTQLAQALRKILGESDGI